MVSEHWRSIVPYTIGVYNRYEIGPSIDFSSQDVWIS